MKNELLIYAKNLYSLGFNITCVSNYLTEHNFKYSTLTKSPHHSIEDLLSSRQSIDELENYDWKNATGLGIVLVQNKYLAIDVDGCNDEIIIQEMLETLELPTDYEWVIKSGSHNGFHIVISIYAEEDYYNENPFGIWNEIDEYGSYSVSDKYEFKVDKIEILGNCNLMMPPSIHCSTLKYEFLNCKWPKSTPNIVFDSNFQEFKKKYLHLSIERESGEIISERYINFKSDFHGINLKSEILSLKDTYYKPKFCLVFDVITTGLQPNKELDFREVEKWPRLVQISWTVLVQDQILKKQTEVVNQSYVNYVPSINLDFGQVEKIGKPLRDVLKLFLNDLKEVDTIIGHNLDFDMNVMQSEIFRLGLNDEFVEKNKLCTMKHSTKYCNLRNNQGEKYPSLQELHKILFNERFQEAHNSIADVLATTRCYIKLAKSDVEPFKSYY